MKKKKEHIDNSNSEALSSKFFDNMEIQFPTTKEDAWKAIESKLIDPPVETSKDSFNFRPVLSIAAGIALILSVAVVMRYYSVDYTSTEGSIAVLLPDDSKIVLEKDSDLKYYPLWWKFSRNLTLSGDASFEVAKGKPFRVSSTLGITEVLGTTFTIHASELTYRVACYTGSVKVTDPASDVSAVLTANEKAELKSPGVFKIELISEEKENNIYPNNFFTFQNQPVQSVFKSLESEFGVEIELEQILDLDFTGNFAKNLKIEEILNAICIPLDLEYVQLSGNKYLVRPDTAK